MESEVNILSEGGIEHLLWTCRIGGWVAIKESGVVRDNRNNRNRANTKSIQVTVK